MSKTKYFERINEKTPNGGSYSIAYFYDGDRNPCEKNKAHIVHIHEYDNDGNIINETFLHRVNIL